MKLRTLKEATIKKGTRAIVRADFDVVTGRAQDNFKIKECLPTFMYLLEKKASLRIIAHLGRPNGHRVKSLSLNRFRAYLERALQRRIIFVTDPFSGKFLDKHRYSPEILLFENIRFFGGEEKNDPRFAKRLSEWGDIYVNEAFANSHRPHASMVLLAKILPSFAGLHLALEVKNLRRIFTDSPRPLVAILAGKKLETKLPLINKFLKQGGEVLLGGALANTHFHRKGYSVGESTVDQKSAERLYYSPEHDKLFPPADFLVSKRRDVHVRLASPEDVRRDEIIYDVGPKTLRLFESRIRRAKTILWNGPLGVVEKKRFSYGTRTLARSIQKVKAFKVVGGGDTVAALKKYGLLRGFSHVSTGGGAMLEFLAGKKLPGIEALKKSKIKMAV